MNIYKFWYLPGTWTATGTGTCILTGTGCGTGTGIGTYILFFNKVVIKINKNKLNSNLGTCNWHLNLW